MTGFAYAQAAPGAFDYLNSLIVPTMLIIGIMYFLMIRPQQKRLKEHQAMIAAIRRGDTVVTSGGILGKVTKVDDQELQVEAEIDLLVWEPARHAVYGRAGEHVGKRVKYASNDDAEH